MARGPGMTGFSRLATWVGPGVVAVARVLALTGVLVLAGCGQQAVHYDMNDVDARGVLRDATPPLNYFGGNIADIRTLTLGDGTVVWATIDTQGNEGMRMTALAVPGSNGGTDVTTAVLPPEGPNHDTVVKRLDQYPAIAKFFHAVLDESVDSALTKRPFDISRTYASMGMAMAEVLPMMRQAQNASGAAAGDAANAQLAADAEEREGQRAAAEQSSREADQAAMQEQAHIGQGTDVQPDAQPTASPVNAPGGSNY